MFNLDDGVVSQTLSWGQRLNQSFNPFRGLSLGLVDVEVLLSQLLGIVAATLFVVLQPAINIPAIAATGTDVPTAVAGRDVLSQEFRLAGLLNLVSGVAGGLPCYMTLSSTIFLKVCGLVERWASLSIAILAAVVALVGPITVINQLPRPAASLFVLHLGCVLSQVREHVGPDRIRLFRMLLFRRFVRWMERNISSLWALQRQCSTNLRSALSSGLWLLWCSS